MKPITICLCLAVLAGCGGSSSLKQAHEAREELMLSQQQLCDSQQEALNSFKWRIESYERRLNGQSVDPVITREQLDGIYHRLVELEKRAGIRDVDGAKIEAGQVYYFHKVFTDPFGEPYDTLDEAIEGKQKESPHHEQ